MSRGIRHAPVCATTGAHSDKPFKRLEHRREHAAEFSGCVELQDENHFSTQIRMSEQALQAIGVSSEACRS